MTETTDKTFYIESLGCITNRADTARVENFLKKNGWHQTSSVAEASLVCLMTCAFTKSAEDINMARFLELKDKKSVGAKIVVGGCLPSINAARIQEEHDGLIFSPRSMEKLDEIISSDIEIKTISPVGVASDDSSVMTIRISTGCLGGCTYCAIPFANGRTKSRSIGDIIVDIYQAESQGFKKIKLISEDLGAYGQDQNQSIVDLLEKITKSNNIGIDFYLDNLNPNWLLVYKSELMALFQSPKIIKKFSIPIQSGSDRLLNLMGRRYKSSNVKEILDDLYHSFSDVQICTDFIVGFPTESQSDFDQTRDILNTYPFYFIEIFTYEDRHGTKASKITPKITETLKEDRRQILFKDFMKNFMLSNDIKNVNDLKRILEARKGLPVHFNMAQ